MNTAGLIMIAAGGALLFYLLHSTYAGLNQPTAPNGGGQSTGSSGSGGGSSGSADIGTHMGLDANGNIVTINSTYANMSDSEKDSANAFAHQFPNGQ